MSFIKGSKSTMAYKAESTWGTRASGNYSGVPFVSEGFDETINKIMSQEIRSDRTVASIRGGNIAAGGPLVTDFSPDRFGLFLKHLLFGTVVTTDKDPSTDVSALAAGDYVRGDLVKSNGHVYLVTLGGTVTGTPALTHTSGSATLEGTVFEYLCELATHVYVHTITAGTTDPVGMSFEKQLRGDSNTFIQLTGGKLDSLALSIPQEGAVQSTWNWLFQQGVKATSTGAGTVAVIAESPSTGYESFVSINAGQTVLPLKSATLDIKNNMEPNIYVVGERTRAEIPEKTRECSGALELYFADMAQYDLFKAETVFDLDLSINRAGEYISFHFPENKFTGNGTPKISGAGLVTGKLDFSSFKQDSSYDCQVTIISLTSTLQ